MRNLSKPGLFILTLFIAFIVPMGTATAAAFAYITNRNSQDVSVIDTATNTVVNTITVGNGPYGVAANLAGTRV
jgi:YVTN family beta-propeller protein